jgi:hypothetical protein
VLNVHRTAFILAFQVHFAEVLNIEVGYNKYYTSYICRSGVLFISFSENIVEKNG